ncbi:MAG: single-stranded-DNA-specific exonuclease RecJ [Bacteroides sp.]|nr:single-stranded-DNA-specific exonuclease RecJ [Eubacterium sp.]MCM1419506.1 single-stranded-DNA-specific exonuclease RecJ [Roseburia sp.]MCM1463269.1 single-stranded-DNA-specific exonuclease RecJ [Bacteroides sp.]
MKKWIVRTPDPATVDELRRETGLDPLICKILAGRGIASRADAEEFFNSETLSDPFLLADMERAVETIRAAVEGGDKITVYGDYDCDGVTSTYMLYSYLEAIGAEVDWYIPSREEGYGLNLAAVELLHKKGTRLIITVDNGIAAEGEARRIAELGMTLVITDHHQVPETLPTAAAIVNPHRRDETASFRKLAGCGVVLKLIAAMEEDGETAMSEYAEFAAAGTVADIVPLVGENRLIVRRGLDAMRCSENLGLSALLRVCGIDPEEEVSSSELAYALCPRINAAGRYAHPREAMELFLADTPSTARAKAEELTRLNDLRKQEEERIIAEAEEQLRADPTRLNRRILILSGEGWNHGVIGIASAKLLHKYGKPNIILTIEGETARGSARSLEGLSLYELLTECKDHLIRYGGHTKAAGLTLKTSEIGAFTAAAYAYAARREPVVETIAADLALAPDELTEESVALLDRLEPFGEENPAPLFLFRDCTVGQKKSLKEGKYISFRFCFGDRELRAVDFGLSYDEFPYREGDRVDFIASVELSEYNGRVDFSIRVADIRPADFGQERYFAALTAYEDLRCGRVDPRLIPRMSPTTEEMRRCYDILRRADGSLARAESEALREGLNPCKFRVALDVFAEFSLAESDPVGGRYRLLPAKGKADLTKSRVLAGLRGMGEA